MNSSYRWYSIRSSGKAIESRSFYKAVIRSTSQDTWFAPADSSNTIRFYRKVQITLPDISDDGTEGARTVESVSTVEFSIVEVGTKTLLRVLNPGRNMQALMSGIERAIGRGFSAKPLSFENGQPSSILGKADVRRMVGIKLVNVAITNDCVGRMEFASKGGVDLQKLTLLRGLKYKIDHVKYEIVINGERGAFSYASNGLVKVGGVLTPLIVHELQRDLARLA